jgi:hypothetical protein
MVRVFRLTLIIGGLAGVTGHRMAEAGVFFHHHEGTPPPGCPRYIEHSYPRAGYPYLVSPCARPAITPAFVGYYVGGGAACLGCPRRVEEGTWAFDYRGHWIPRHIGLGWSHGRLYQGGIGAYEPDGHPVPDVIGLTVSKLHNH